MDGAFYHGLILRHADLPPTRGDLTRKCGLRSHDFNFVLADRTIRIDVFPVGIETSAFADLSQRSGQLEPQGNQTMIDMKRFVCHVRCALVVNN